MYRYKAIGYKYLLQFFLFYHSNIIIYDSSLIIIQMLKMPTRLSVMSK